MGYEFAGVKIADTRTDTLAAALAEKFPNTWRRCYTKHYDAPGVYRSFKYVAVQFAMGVIGVADSRLPGRRKQDEIVSNIPVLFDILEKHDWPTYHVHGLMLAAMRRTHPPKGRTWEDVRMPYPGIIFMVPNGSVLMPPIGLLPGSERMPIAYIGVARIDRSRFKFRSEYGEDDGADRMCVFWSADTPDGPIAHDCCFPVTQALEPDPKWIDDATMKQCADGFVCDDQVDSRYTVALAGVIANLLLLREARPEQIEPGMRTKRTLKNGTSVHQPTFIGRRYAVRSDTKSPDMPHGRFTELGWRAGHMKEQPCGSGRKDRRTIWVEPYMAHVRGLTVENGAETASAAPK